MSMTTWRELIEIEMKKQQETFDDVVKMTLSSSELEEKFKHNYLGPNGREFTLWTETRVYFPTEYDGREEVKSVPRNPCSEKTEHI